MVLSYCEVSVRQTRVDTEPRLAGKLKAIRRANHRNRGGAEPGSRRQPSTRAVQEHHCGGGARPTDMSPRAHRTTRGYVVARQARNGGKRRRQSQEQCVKIGADLAQGRQKGAKIKRKSAKKGPQTQSRVTGPNE